MSNHFIRETRMDINQLTYQIRSAIFAVNKVLGSRGFWKKFMRTLY